MVSLSRNFNTTSGGATFFSDSANMEDREHLQPHLESYKIFKPLRTIPAASVLLVASFALEVTAIILAILHPDEQSKCRSYFIVLYIHVALWFLTLFIDYFVKRKHHELRLNGYLEFYKKTYIHHRLSFYVVSLWTCVLLLLQTIMQHYYPDNFAEQCIRKDLLTPLNYICAVITLEVCVLFGITTNYIVKVQKFNKLKILPDVQKEEWQACSTNEGIAGNEVGYRQQGDRMNDFVEKQADLIRYLKEHNNRLSEKVMILNAQVQARSRPAN
ncbi:uncharacterized protein CBL_07861 [Carabus blaptoides fortunei]